MIFWKNTFNELIKIASKPRSYIGFGVITLIIGIILFAMLVDGQNFISLIIGMYKFLPITSAINAKIIWKTYGFITFWYQSHFVIAIDNSVSYSTKYNPIIYLHSLIYLLTLVFMVPVEVYSVIKYYFCSILKRFL